MKIEKLDEDDLKILLDSSCWQLVCSDLAPEAETVVNKKHESWLRTHSDQHPQKEILLALQDSTICSLNEKSYKTVPGTIFLFDKFEIHDQNYFQFDPGLKHLWLFLVGKKIISRLIVVENKKMRFGTKEFIVEKDYLFSTLLQTWKQLKIPSIPQKIKRQKIVSALSLIFMEIAELYLLPPPDSS